MNERSHQDKTRILLRIRHEPFDKVEDIDTAIAVVWLVWNERRSSDSYGCLLEFFPFLISGLELQVPSERFGRRFMIRTQRIERKYVRPTIKNGTIR